MKKFTLFCVAVMIALCIVSCSKANKLPSASAAAKPQTETKVETKAEVAAAAPVEVKEEPKKELTFKEGTTLRMATGYNSKKTGLFFDADTAGEGIELAGVTYHAGDLKPTWVEVEKRLGVKLVDKYQGNSATNELKYWKEQLDQVDLVSGNATALNEYGEAGLLVNIADYLDYIPNFKAYLEANPIVRLSITGNTSTGSIYFAPYFDGVNDIERMPLMRTDWVEMLLDGEGKFTADKSANLAKAVYEPYMPTSGSVKVDAVSSDGSKVIYITKNYEKAGNIVDTMNKALAKGVVSGVEAVNMLRDYIDNAYDGYYGSKRSNLFIGQDAAWDADELVALLRCVCANAYTLNGTDNVEGLFLREDNNLQRQVDLYRFAGTLFGVRGLEARNVWYYIGADGELKDSRTEVATYKALEKMHALVQEGLISESFVKSSKESSSTMLENNLGFMSYDYNQTQTLLNATKLKVKGGKYMAVMVPVARWYDGTNSDGVYMRFTESWRSVKTDAWAISKAGVGNDQDKLFAALKIFDYAFSEEGQILMSYGPDDFIKKNADGSYVTFSFNGKQMPVIADITEELLWKLASGNYTNFARYYLGSTLSFAKSQAFEYQCTLAVGKEGAGYISNAIGLGTIKHPELALAKNPWYTSMATVLPTTKVENDTINTYTQLNEQFSEAKGKFSVIVDQIQKGYTLEGVNSAEDMADLVKNTWGGAQTLMLRNGAWKRLVLFYNKVNK